MSTNFKSPHSCEMEILVHTMYLNFICSCTQNKSGSIGQGPIRVKNTYAMKFHIEKATLFSSKIFIR